MRVLFVDDTHPGHFRHLPARLGADPANEVVFAAQRFAAPVDSTVRPMTIGTTRDADDGTHPYLRRYEKALVGGLMAYDDLGQLRDEGFVPDVIVVFSGWGLPMFLKDRFPESKLVVYSDWYYWPHNSNYDFFPNRSPDVDRACRLSSSNAANVMELLDADWVMVTTRWQLSTFPAALWAKISVIHDGIDIDTFRPLPTGQSRPGFVHGDLDLSGVSELVTYATRGKEPYRGFEQLMEAVVRIQRERSQAHVVIAGDDDNHYSYLPPDGEESWKTYTLNRLGDQLDPSRLHLTGPLPQDALVRLLQASDCHIHLTAPFLPSWSLFEAMATGCAIVASATPPVQEIVQHDVHGKLVDFFDVDGLVSRVGEVLDDRAAMEPLRHNARARMVDGYALDIALGRQIEMLRDVVARRQPHETCGWSLAGTASDPAMAAVEQGS